MHGMAHDIGLEDARPTAPGEENRRAWLEVSGLAFDRAERRCCFLKELYDSDHKKEALLLCLCYIDGLAYYGWPEIRESKRRFVDVLARHGGDATLADISPSWLLRALRQLKSSKALAGKIEPVLGGVEGRLHQPNEILNLLRPDITADEVERLSKELWRGSLAAIAYEELRCALVHALFAVDGVLFSPRDAPSEERCLDFPMLYACLRHILPEARNRYLDRGPNQSRACAADELL
jgi:hypothetical protein